MKKEKVAASFQVCCKAFIVSESRYVNFGAFEHTYESIQLFATAARSKKCKGIFLSKYSTVDLIDT